MMRHRRLRDRELLAKALAPSLVTLGDGLENLKSPRIGKGLGDTLDTTVFGHRALRRKVDGAGKAGRRGMGRKIIVGATVRPSEFMRPAPPALVGRAQRGEGRSGSFPRAPVRPPPRRLRSRT